MNKKKKKLKSTYDCFLPEHLVREVTNQGKTHGPRTPLNE